jgi:two-component system chemotaxis response regulator CheB
VISGKVRVLIVDDSAFFRSFLAKVLSQDPNVLVVGEASDPYKARDKILELQPDVLTLDIEMPLMNGIDFLKVLMPQWPIPVIVISNAVSRAKEAIAAGALDFIAKPKDTTPTVMQTFSQELQRQIRAPLDRLQRTKLGGVPERTSTVINAGTLFYGFIAIGASTGGTQATGKILKAMPADSPGILVVQHMPPDFTGMYARNLDQDCAMKIKEAVDGDIIERGKVLIAPGGDRQCEVRKVNGRFCVHLFPGPKVNGHCPSVDVMFQSVANVAMRNDAVGVILTGMGADGARGLLAMRGKGMYTIGQDEKTCVVYGMPKEAFSMGAVCRQASIENIAGILVAYSHDLKR